MRILKAKVTNFGSYGTLEFDYSAEGLTLVHGATGSGKSTLLDIPVWVLYGETAKQGAVNDVISWTAEDNGVEGCVELETPTGKITVTRKRGRSNDLYWIEEGSDELKRGKDYNDTQCTLNARLGCNLSAFLSGSYYSELSNVANFFLAKAKDRREVIAQVVDVSFCDQLTAALAESKKKNTKDLNNLQSKVQRLSGALENEERQVPMLEYLITSFDKSEVDKEKRTKVAYEEYEVKRSFDLERLRAQKRHVEAQLPITETLDMLKLEIEELEAETCSKCLGPANPAQMSCLQKERDTLLTRLNASRQAEAHNKALLAHMKQLKTIKNPNTFTPGDMSQLIQQLEVAITKAKATKDALEDLSRQEQTLIATISRLEHLADLTQTLRSRQVEGCVTRLEEETNRHLAESFDSEFRVSFTLSAADNLEVTIEKNGYECAYRQLSKGQRQLLKLSFVLSVMSATQDKTGVQFDNLFFDEAFDGLDSEFKIKAFSLLENLTKSHCSIMLIDHAEALQEAATNRIKVELVDDQSRVIYED